jgi:cobaltochelatase CobT
MNINISKLDAIEMFKEVRAKAIRVTPAVTTALRRLLSGTDDLGKSRHEESGRLNSRDLVRFATGDANVFSRRTRREGEDCAVSVLLDLSGSMNGERIATAQQVVVQLGGLLDGCRARWSCTGYSANEAEFLLEKGEGTEITSVVNTVDFIDIKKASETTGQAAAMLGSIKHLCGGATPDYAAPVLHMREMSALPESRKILILLTDAASTREDEAAEIIKLADELKINLVVIGISTGKSLTECYGDRSANVERVEDLAQQAFKHLLNRVGSNHRVCV